MDWINTIGTRMPSLTRADLERVLTKLGSFVRGPTRPHGDPTNLRVHSPVMWPRLRTRAERELNGALLRRALAPVLERADAVITMVPVVADLARRTPHLNWIYYCADDLSEWPGLDGPTLLEMERDLLASVRKVVVVSDHLRDRLASLGADSSLLTHGVDVEHWCAATGRGARRPAGARARALYWGLADPRLDTEICLAIASRAELFLAGPRQNVDPRLLRHESIRWLGPVAFEDLPRIANDADVLVMPYADLPVTRACQPLKLKEYLATLMPVVVTPLPANVPWGDALDLASTPERFTKLVLQRASRPLPANQLAARERLASESWEAKARVFEARLFENASEGVAAR